jgi:hypothetical protein
MRAMGLAPCDALLFEACDKGDSAALEAELARGGVPSAVNALGQNALFFAGSAAVAERLVGLVSDAVDHTGATAVTRAMAGNKEVFRVLVARLGEFQGWPLHVAAESGDWKACELLVASGRVQVDAKDDKGLTPFLLAAKGGSVAVAERLIEHADVSATDARGRNALHLAVIGGHVELARFLAQSDADWAEQADAEGKTPLQYAEEGSEMKEALGGSVVKQEVQEVDAGIAKLPAPAATVAAAPKGHRLVVFEDDVLDVQAGGIGSGELEACANAFFEAGGERMAVVSSSLSCVHIPSSSSAVPGRIRRSLAIVFRVL